MTIAPAPAQIADDAAGASTAAAKQQPAWDEPTGLRPRGTVVVIAGRGESARVYERFGRRISADAWRVRIVTGAHEDVAAARGRVRALLADADLPAPRVVVGSDVGAALALQLATEAPDGLDAVVLAGLPTRPSHRASGHEHELRSACPVHRATLDDQSLVVPGALALPIPRELLDQAATEPTLPILVVHGEADPVAPLAHTLEVFASFSGADVVAVAGGLHDILNDLSHRSVAATIVLFLERLKAGAEVVRRIR